MQVLLVSGHYLHSKRQAGFHFLADAYWRRGATTIFLTTGLSWLSVLRRDYRLAYPVRAEANRLRWARERLGSYVWFTRWHPANLRLALLNRLTRGLFTRYGELPLGEAEALVRDTDLMIFESTPGLLLFERFKRLNPRARCVYRVSDDLGLLRNHPVVREAEQRFAPRFDLISTPCEYIHRRFQHLPQAALHYHGLAKDLFDRDYPNPYCGGGEVNLLFVGGSYCDVDFIERASRRFPNWAFHVIGPIAHLPRRDNVIAYGEMPFVDTIGYVKHADVGLQTRSYTPGAESLTDSLKTIQYTYCRLPIVAPEFLRTPKSLSPNPCGTGFQPVDSEGLGIGSKPNRFYYRPGDTESIRQALTDALAFDRRRIDTSDIRTWDELATCLANVPQGPS